MMKSTPVKVLLLVCALNIRSSDCSAQDSGANSIQTPSSVLMEAKGISDRFVQILEEECPVNVCNAIGCQASRFQTLDETQDSSLPGLATGESQAKSIQHKLTAVQCEFTYEPTFDDNKLASLRQRLMQRVRLGGVSVQLVSRKLLPKEAITAPDVNSLNTDKLSASELLARTFIPFLPWIMILVILSVSSVTMFWLWRRPKRISGILAGAGGDAASDDANLVPATLLMERSDSLRAAYKDNPKLAELALKPLLESGDLDELCRMLKHFGPELLTPFKERGQFSGRLDQLANRYQEYKSEENPSEFWAFLERSDRRLTAAKVRISSDPLQDEFAFMDQLQVDELIGLLRELTEVEGIAIVVNGPARLRTELFAKAGPRFVSTFIDYLSGHERLSDQFVRTAIQKARRIYEEKSAELRVVPLNRVPLFEEALNSLDGSERMKLMGEIQKNQSTVLSSMTPRIFLDASLSKIPDDILNEVMLQISPKAAAAYIHSLPSDIEIMSRLKPRVQESIKRFIGQETLDVTLVKEARQAIAQYIKDRDAAGEIDLGKINSSLFK
jgi:hypothetical protein